MCVCFCVLWGRERDSACVAERESETVRERERERERERNENGRFFNSLLAFVIAVFSADIFGQNRPTSAAR